MIEDMEIELTEASVINSKTDKLAVTEKADVDEAIPSYIYKEKKIQAYNTKMRMYIKSFTPFEKRNKAEKINGRQSTKLYKNLISKNLVFFQVIL